MRRAVENIKLCLIFALFVSMLCLFAVYLSSAPSASLMPEQKIPLEKWIIFTSGFNPAENKINPAHLMPEFIAFTSGRKSTGSIGDRELTVGLMLSLSGVLDDLLCPDSSAQTLPGGEGAQQWEAQMTGGDYIYLKFAGDLPLAACTVFLSGAGINENLTQYCREMIIYSDGGRPAALCRDGGGSVTRLANPASDTVFNNDTIKEYTDNVGGTSFRFAAAAGGDYTSLSGAAVILPDTYPVTTGAIYSARLECDNRLNDSSLDATDEPTSETPVGMILGRLGFNLDLLNMVIYSDPVDTRVYTSDFGDLWVYADGRVTYLSSGAAGGLHLSRLLGRDIESYSVWDCVRAASILADRLPKDLCGGEADLALSGVYRDGNDVCVTFDYYVDGRRVVYAEDEVVSNAVFLRFSKTSLTSMNLRCAYLRRADRMRNLPLSVSLMQTPGGALAELELIYRVDYSGGTFAPVYSYVTDTAGGERT